LDDITILITTLRHTGVLFIVRALVSDAALAADCCAVPGGPPCAGSSVASVDGNGGLNAGAGNPINIITGNKYQREHDTAALPGALGLKIVRYHISAYSKTGITKRFNRTRLATVLRDRSIRPIRPRGSTAGQSWVS
jgi:hypothetical protein